MSTTTHIHRIESAVAHEFDSGSVAAQFQNGDRDTVWAYWQNLTQAMDDISGLLQQLGNIAYNRRAQAGELDDDPTDAYAQPGERFYE